MGVTLFDEKSGTSLYDTDFWHWRAIVETVRSLAVLEEARVDTLDDPFLGELTRDEARAVAEAVRGQILVSLADDERLLLDGTRTKEPDDGMFHRAPTERHKNYSTTRDALEAFAVACETCSGLRVS